MQTLHIRASDSAAIQILQNYSALVEQGESVELIDDKVYLFERAMISKSIEDVASGKSFTSEEVWQELLNED